MHVTVRLIQEYRRTHDVDPDDMIMLARDGDSYVVTGHRPKYDWEKTINWCCDPGNCSTHREVSK